MKKIKRKMNEVNNMVEFVFDPNSTIGLALEDKPIYTSVNNSIFVANLPVAYQGEVAIATDGGNINFGTDNPLKESVAAAYNESEKFDYEEDLLPDDIDKITRITPISVFNIQYPDNSEDLPLELSWGKSSGYLPDFQVDFIAQGEKKSVTVTLDVHYYPSDEVADIYTSIRKKGKNMKKITMENYMNEGGGAGVEFVFDPNSRTGRSLRTEADLTGEGGLKISVANLPIASYENSAVATDGGYIQFDETKVKEAVVRDYNEYERDEDEPKISVDDIEKIVEVNPSGIPNLMYSAGWTRATLSTDGILTWDKHNQNGYFPEVEVIFILNGEEKNLIVTVDGEYHPSAEAVEVYNTIDDIEDEEDYDENYKGKKVMKKSVNENDRLSEIWDYLVDTGVATEEELQLVTDINGYTEEALNDVIYARTGYHDLEQLKGEDEDYNENLKTKKIAKKSVNENMTVKKAKDLYKKHGMLFLDDEDGRAAYDALHNAGYTLKKNTAGDVAHVIEFDRMRESLETKKSIKSESLSSSILKEAHSVLSMNENESGEMTTWQFTARGFSKAMVNKQPVFGSADVHCIIHENADGKVVGTAVVAYYMNEAQVEEAIKKALAENGFKTSNITDLVNLY